MKIDKDRYGDGYQIISKLICIDVHKGGWWFRLYFFPFDGQGLVYKNLKHKTLGFSERNGFKKYLRLGNWVFRTHFQSRDKFIKKYPLTPDDVFKPTTTTITLSGEAPDWIKKHNEEGMKNVVPPQKWTDKPE